MAGGMLSNLESSAKGMFFDGAGEKAVLYIYLTDLSKNGNREGDGDFGAEIDELVSLQKDLYQEAKNKLKAAPEEKKSFTDKVKGGLKSVGSALAPGQSSADNVGSVDSEHNKFVKFEVQYNPESIRLYSLNGKLQSKRGTEGIDELKVYNFSGKSKLSFNLIFDDVDNMNAFLLNDVVNMNATNALKKGYDTYTHGGNNYSVRKKMDAIMSLLSSHATQQVVFYWANMVFRGTITDVSNRFTMFNPQGHPVRGEMHIELTQDKKYAELKYDEDYWKKSFDKVFSDGSAKGMLEKAMDTVEKYTPSTLINL